MRLLHYAIHYDLAAFGWLQQRRNRELLAPWARRVSRTGDGYFYSLFVLYSLIAENYTLLKVALVGLGCERFSYFLLKNCTKRNRPPQAIPGFVSIITASDKFSFPSGHTSAAFLLATLAYLYFPAMGWALYPWACTVACSRVILGVHFPSDTLAGALLGTGVALACFEVLG